MGANFKSNPPKTLLTIVVGFLVVFIVTQLKWTLIVAIIVGVIGVLSSYLSQKIEWTWMKLAMVLSYIVPNIVLSLIFFLFLLPIGLLYRLFRKEDPFRIKNPEKSAFVDSSSLFDKASFERMY